MAVQSIGVVGASGYVGSAVVAAVTRVGVVPLPFSRQQREGWLNLSDAPTQDISHWIDVGPIHKFLDRAEHLKARGAKKIIATSSTSRFTRAQDISDKFAQGEKDVQLWCEANSIEWLILRPTMIYGLGRDVNIKEIAAMIRKVGFFPILGTGAGKRQPIHVEDLASAFVSALLSGAANKAYNVSGGEVLAYRDMIKRIALAMGRKPLTPRVPLSAFKAALAVLTKVPRFKHWNATMAERMGIDMAFDHAAAADDFGFSPRPFVLSDRDIS